MLRLRLMRGVLMFMSYGESFGGGNSAPSSSSDRWGARGGFENCTATILFSSISSYLPLGSVGATITFAGVRM